MVYMDGDNDIEHDAIVDFLETSSVDSASNLNIVVQFDRFAGGWGYEDDTRYGNWTDCKRFVVKEGMAPTAENATMDIGEVDMANPQTLMDFVNWTIENYPANHYALDLWDHGGDWYGLCWDFDSGGRALELGMLGDALQTLQDSHQSLVYDMIALDDCSMGSIEVASELKGYADYLLASEIYIPNDGLNYSSLQAIVDTPDIATPDLCNRFMTDYSTYYNSLVGTPREFQLNESFTLSVVDLNAIEPLVRAVDALAVEMIANRNAWWDDVQQARNLTENYSGWSTRDVVDIYHWCERLGEELGWDPTARSLISNVKDAFNVSVIGEIHGTNPANCTVPVDHAHGITIYYPKGDAYLEGMYLWIGNWFQANTQWDEFLGTFHQGFPHPTSYQPTGTDVSVDAAITVWVSEPIYTALPYSLEFYPTDMPGSPVEGDLHYSAADNKLEFVPKTRLLPGTSYTAVVRFYDSDFNNGGCCWQFSTAGEIPEFSSAVSPLLAVLVIVLAASRRRAGKEA
jgi:hypothetical protein